MYYQALLNVETSWKIDRIRDFNVWDSFFVLFWGGIKLWDTSIPYSVYSRMVQNIHQRHPLDMLKVRIFNV